MSASLVGSEMCIRDRAWTDSPERVLGGRLRVSAGLKDQLNGLRNLLPGCLLYTSDAADDM
eukprot:11459549-Alexandrium_andersonii.AAC.1